MKRFLFGGSCLGMLLCCGIGTFAAFLLATVIFQQSQATTSNAISTTNAVRASPTFLPAIAVVTGIPIVVSQVPFEVTIEVEVPQPTLPPDADVLPTDTLTPADSATMTSPLDPTMVTELPRNSGTSTYPLTITAEVMLAQTHVAAYQSGIAATRTALAAESEAIYATLTAKAPVGTNQ